MAADNLAYIIISGFTDEFEIYKPKYLNFFTVSISRLRTYIYSLQFINIAVVLPMFISKLFLSQNFIKQFISSYNSNGDGAISTKSSAKANMNN